MSEAISTILNSLAHDAEVFGKARLNGPTRRTLVPYVRGEWLRLLHRAHYHESIDLSFEMLSDFTHEVRKGVVARVAWKLTS